MKNLAFGIETGLYGKSWNDLSAGIKSSIVMEAIDKLYFPYEEEIGEDEFQTHESYMEFVMDSVRGYGLGDVGPLSWFWGTEWSGDGKREKFTDMVKDIFHKVMEIGKNCHIKEFDDGCPYSFLDNVYFTAWKSNCVCMVSDEGKYRFNNNVCDQWDGYVMGYIDLMVSIIDFLVIEY